MLRIEVAVEIKRSIEEVWAYVADPSKLPEWDSGALEAKASEMPLHKGSTVMLVLKFLGRRIETTLEVTQLEVNKTFSVRATRPFPFDVTYTVEPVDGGTRVREVAEGETRGFFKLADPIIENITERQAQADLETLKALLEARVPAKA